MNNNPRDINSADFEKCLTSEDKIRFLLKYAVLAPSTHNTQPWLFKIEKTVCSIYINQKYRLPEADPHGRDIFISIGCCVENLVLAAKYFGFFDKIDFITNGNDAVAKIYFKEGGSQDKKYEPLVLTIPRRINARGIFKNESISQSLIDSVTDNLDDEYIDILQVNFVKEKMGILKIADLTAEGLKTAYRRKSFRKEMYKWMNNSLTKKKEGIPGYALKMPFLASFILPTTVRFFNIGKLLAKLNYKSVSSVPLITIISSRDNTPIVWLKTGRLIERLMLDFNSKGLNTSIFSASIEMGDLYKDVQKVINTNQIPQFLFVVGKVDSIHKPTPRHDLVDKIIK